MKLLLQFIEAHETREAAKEAKKAAEGEDMSSFSWDDAKERLLQDMKAARSEN